MWMTSTGGPVGAPADHSAGHDAMLPGKPSLKNRHLFALPTAVMALVIGFGASALLTPPRASQAVPTRPEPALFSPNPDQLRNLTIAPISMAMFQSETLTDGYIAINEDRSTPVFSPFSGRVTQIFVKLGDHVKKGQPLFAVEASEYVQAVSELVTAKAHYDLAATNEQRQHELYDAEGAALRDWQQAQVDLAAARASMSAARNKLQIYGKTGKEIDTLQGTSLQSTLNPESIVAAPISGTVVLRQIGLGQYVQAGSTNPVFSIGDLSDVWMVANVRESDASHVHFGDAVEVRALAFPDKVFKATISYVAPSIDPATRRLAVRADVEDREGLLKPQMFAQFTILAGNSGEAPAMPASGIIHEGDETRVWVQNADGTLASRQIRTGRSSEGMVEVTSGLEPGTNVVTSGALFIDRAAAIP